MIPSCACGGRGKEKKLLAPAAGEKTQEPFLLLRRARGFPRPASPRSSVRFADAPSGTICRRSVRYDLQMRCLVQFANALSGTICRRAFRYDSRTRSPVRFADALSGTATRENPEVLSAPEAGEENPTISSCVCGGRKKILRLRRAKTNQLRLMGAFVCKS